MHGTQSSANRALMLNTLHDPCFEVDDLDGVNFQEIKEQLREDVQSLWVVMGGAGLPSSLTSLLA
jgi:two-component sensor histidine kinase